MARMISYREAINEALALEMERDPSVIVMGEDNAGGEGSPGEEDAWGGVLGVTKGLYHRLVSLGRIDRLLTDEAVEEAMHEPPEDTRAYFRGRCLAKYPDSIAAASWDSVIFDLPGHESLQRVPTIDPLRGSRAHVGDLIDNSDTALSLFEALTR